MPAPKIRPNNQMLLRNEIYLWGEINEGSSFHVVQDLHYLFLKKGINQRANLYIHSDGGCLDATAAILDEIQYWTKQGATISTICQGKAYSAAAILLALGTKGERFAFPNSSIMLHEPSYDLPEDKAEQQQKAAEFYASQIVNWNRLLCEAVGVTGRKKVKFLEDVKSTLWLNASSAIKYGIIDGIRRGEQ